MSLNSIAFLKGLLSAPGPSGDETAASRVWRAEANKIADEVHVDISGSSIAILQGDQPRVLLAGHIDEIGFMISYIHEDGFLSFLPIGDWDSQVLVGQRVRLIGIQADVYGIIGKKDTVFMDDEEKKQVTEIKKLWIDIGVTSRAQAAEYIRVGTVGVLDVPILELPNNRIVSRGIDNRIGAFAILEVLRQLSRNRPKATVAAVATTQEEITSYGAKTITFRFKPNVALVIDMAYATDPPESNKNEYGEVTLGGGPVLSRGAANNPIMYDQLIALAERESIPYCLQMMPEYTATDADTVHLIREGVATVVISIPSRYMHTPNEMVDLSDIEKTVQLIVAFIHSLTPESNFVPR
ncbi:M42 family metallopeptidase [candidate division CSSED10-310 bacterium]|uniref:M42 family metallopeptidase n=1 Tax=candidate division CSSED10-310 bacterium TaxID=2855610 RepID=A0ABV6YRB4_UNCC1